ncbi:MAG: dependent epimerase/dehydratase [Moraxellaceae bacterium]|jgi:UDP-glucose 4-epimerase|nr:dependent epimerase/dehydratase [Moraxellaceae bacterium]
MKLLLTGANGYVGSELLATLTAAGHEVWCVTRTARPLPGVPSTRQLVHDLRMPLAVAADDFDLVIHAAGANDVQSRDPAEALALTALTARQCAEFAVRQKTPRLLYLSTFQVYGVDEGAVDESTPCRPRNDYALTHLFAEQWIEQYGRTHGLAYVLARPANIAGMPRAGDMLRWTLAPGCFCRDAITQGRVLVRSTGLQQRDFLPLREVARQLSVIAGDFSDYANGIVNICAGASLTIAEVAGIAADRFRAVFGRDCPLEFAPAPGAPTTAGAPLQVSGRYLEQHPADRLTHARALELMNESVDHTYHYLRAHAQLEMSR